MVPLLIGAWKDNETSAKATKIADNVLRANMVGGMRSTQNLQRILDCKLIARNIYTQMRAREVTRLRFPRRTAFIDQLTSKRPRVRVVASDAT